jgi:Uncharacterized protein conserved in bacteria
MSETPQSVIDFWFRKLTPAHWFTRNDTLDREIRDRFLDLHLELSRNVPDEWRASAEARLALIIVFDQFPRNMFRGSPHAFATDVLAREEARIAVATGADQAVEEGWRQFFYLPFEHSESLEDQDRSVALFTALGDPSGIDYAVRHRDVIAKYGRFPHRNRILGRENTPEEAAYLAQPGAGF